MSNVVDPQPYDRGEEGYLAFVREGLRWGGASGGGLAGSATGMGGRAVMPRRQYTIEAHRPSSCSVTLFVAVRLADAFRTRLPTVQQLQSQFGMSRATAYRWLAALKAARGVPCD